MKPNTSMDGNHENTSSEYGTENEDKEDVKYKDELKSNCSSSVTTGTEVSEHHKEEIENVAIRSQKVSNVTQQFELAIKDNNSNDTADVSTSYYTESSYDSEGSVDDDFSSGTGISLSSSQRSSDHGAALPTELLTSSGIQRDGNKGTHSMSDPSISESYEGAGNSQKADYSLKEGETADLIQLASDSQGSSTRKSPENMSAPLASEETFMKILQVPGMICNSTPKSDNESLAPVSIEQMLFEDFPQYHENSDRDHRTSPCVADISGDDQMTGNMPQKTSVTCKSNSALPDDFSDMSNVVKKSKKNADRLSSIVKSHDRKKKKKSSKEPIDDDDKYELFKPINVEICSPHSKESTPKKSIKSECTTEDNSKRLTEELVAEKRKNKKLSEKIIYLEETLEGMRLHKDLEKAEAKMPGHILSLVEGITKSQKLREGAMLNRIQIAVKDRDEAFLRTKALYVKIQQLQRKCDSKHSRYQDKTLSELLEKVKSADSGRVIEKYGKEVVERLEQLKRSRGRIVSEEMNSVIQEKDNAIARCHKLELDLQNCLDELNRLKQSQDISFSMSLKAKAIAAQNEKTKAEENLQNAEEEIQMLRIYHSLHKSLAISQDEEMTQKYNQYLASIREEASKRVAQAKQIEAENHQLYDKLRMVTEEKFSLQGNYDDVEADNSHLKAKCIKLERLVEVLRKTVIDFTRAQTSTLMPPTTNQTVSQEVEHE